MENVKVVTPEKWLEILADMTAKGHPHEKDRDARWPSGRYRIDHRSRYVGEIDGIAYWTQPK